MKIISASRRQLNLCRRVRVPESDRKEIPRLASWAWGCTALVMILSFGGIIARSQNAATTDTSRVLPFLERTIQWYRQLSVEQQIATDPNDLIVVNDNRQVADQVVRLAFDYARAQADLAGKPRSTQAASAQRSGYSGASSISRSILWASFMYERRPGASRSSAC